MRKRTLYDSYIGTLALMISVMIITDMFLKLPNNIVILYCYIDNIVWSIFAVDYFVRFFIAKDKLNFIMENLIDLASLISISIFFDGLNFIGVVSEENILSTISLLKIIRLLILLWKFRQKINGKIKLSRPMYIISATILTILIAALMISVIEKITFSDALWWSFVTFTTVGYGDVMLKTGFAKIVAVILMIFGIGFIGVTTSSVAIYLINGRCKPKKRYNFKQETLREIKDRVDNIDELSDEDIENIYKTLKALKRNDK